MSVESARGSWSNRLGFVLAAAGSAVGLGNIWKFPYMAGENGGAAFIFVYVVSVFAICLPIVVAELMLGRASRRNPVGAFRSLRPRSFWVLGGWLGVLSGFLILSFYGVVAGWTLDFMLLSASGRFSGAGGGEIHALFDGLVGSAPRQIFWQALFMTATIVIVAGGISSGIERGSRILLPALLFMLIGLVGFSLTLSGAGEAATFLLTPRWEEFSGGSLLAALGQAFFSLSLGMGVMITYGSYLGSGESLSRSAFYVALTDTAVALLAGAAIFPIVFTFGFEPAAGPGLTFQTLPVAFAQLPWAGMLAFTFFLLLSLAALTSSISLLEVVVAYFIDEWHWHRVTAAWFCGGVTFLVGVPCAVDSAWIEWLDALTSNYFLPIGGLLIAAFAGWGLVPAEQESELGTNGVTRVWRFMIRWVSPAAVVAIFLSLVLG
ncbi:MAG: sodium-dependent transporter [Nitrococcus mobilis]|nr:sodium-dependent transporter [Nitrococcus mobilis]